MTFVVPSIGRPTLRRALDSFAAQTNRAFSAVLVMDGCAAPDYVAGYGWLRAVALPARAGVRNHAGEVRNVALRLADTDWVAFLDDDDTAAPAYVERLSEEIRRRPGADAVVFRMRTDKAGRGVRVLPPPGAEAFVKNQVGISFAARRLPACLGGEAFSFVPGPTEDFCALDRLRSAGGEVVLSDSVEYFVEMDPE